MRTRMSPPMYVRKETPNKFLTATAERVDTDDTSQAVSLSSRSSRVIMKNFPCASAHTPPRADFEPVSHHAPPPVYRWRMMVT